MDRSSLVALGVLLPLVAVVQPIQPIRALAAEGLLLLLPGLAVARLLRPGDAILFVVVAFAASLALSVLTATGLMYAGIWSWQLTLVLLGVITADGGRGHRPGEPPDMIAASVALAALIGWLVGLEAVWVGRSSGVPASRAVRVTTALLSGGTALLLVPRLHSRDLLLGSDATAVAWSH